MGTVKYTGPVASFHCPTNAEIRSLKVHFSPKQEGNGDPSPENVREIVGWDGVEVNKSGRNLMHLIGYSAVNLTATTATRKLTNGNGTTINTIDPEKSVTITQTFWPATNKYSYQNGYFIVMDDNLKFEERYDISFRVTNITNNPLNATLSDLMLYNPKGTSVGNTKIIDGDRVTFKNAIYNQNTATPLRHGFDIRICGMSCTISDFIVTVVDTEDRVYEPYQGSTTDYEFGVLGKNKVPWISPDGFTKGNAYNGNSGWSTPWAVPKNANGVKITYSADIDNTNGAGSAFLHIWTKDENDNFVDTSITSSSLDIGSSGRLSKTITLNTNRYSYVIFGLTMNNATASHPMVELGSTSTTYEPYDPNHTVYGGWVDLISGEVCEEYRYGGFDNFSINAPSGTGVWEHRFNLRGTWVDNTVGWSSAGGAFDWYCDSITRTNNAISNYQGHSGAGVLYIYDDTITTVQDFKTKYADVKIVYKMKEAIYEYYTLAPTQLQTFLGQNNVWSNADYVEVEYDLHETQDILARKQFIMANQPHIVKPAAAPLQNFATDMVAPLKECKVYFSPVQEGSGDPSPENVRPISGWTECEVYRGYEYLSNVQITTGKTLNASGLEATESGMAVTDYIPVEVGHTYTLKFTSTTAGRTRRIFGYSASKEPTSQLVSVSWATVGYTFSMNAEIPSDTSYIRACYYNGDIGKTLTEPSAVTTLSLDWTDSAGTVYGGYVDLVKGEVVAEWYKVVADGVNVTANSSYMTDDYIAAGIVYLNPNGMPSSAAKYANNVLCNIMPVYSQYYLYGHRDEVSYPYASATNAGLQYTIFYLANRTDYPEVTDATSCKNFVNSWLQEHPATLVYELRTPITYQIDPITLKTLRGTNNIWASNGGDNIEIAYWKH